MKKYSFRQLAERNCMECTTTVTTTAEPEKYYLVSDVEDERRRLREKAKKEIAGIIGGTFTDYITQTVDIDWRDVPKLTSDRIISAIFGDTP